MQPNVPAQSTEAILAHMKMMWETDKSHHTMMAAQMVGMVYELFGDPPSKMPAKERLILKSVNDIEAELIRLESRVMAMQSGLTPLVVVPKMALGNAQQAIEAISRFTLSLSDHVGDMLQLTQSSHKYVLDLRSDLLKGYE